ncbi:MAG: HlyU family transcriptional regulator [Candidatus Competibacteraceae bacterium]|nr:HlyU family transcriptional regulator [Candidatus Competibacteraceae bacterium]
MGLGELFKGLFGGTREAEPAEPVTYRDFQIIPHPKAEGGRYFIAGTIRKETGQGLQEHHFIRADQFTDRDLALEQTVLKAQRIIDEQGDGLFRQT